MTAYYNEIDPYAAQWLRNLIDAGHIAPGDVDERDVRDVRPEDVRGYEQCHFFAGIGGWSFAARLAGWPDKRPLWTASCPCQPFSRNGARAGEADSRHLWPFVFKLIGKCQPAIVAGEQVAGVDGLGWFDGVSSDLGGINYASGAVVAPAAAVGAPHRRDRIYFVAHPKGDGRQGKNLHPEAGLQANRVKKNGWGDYQPIQSPAGSRRIKPGIELLADGLPSRVGRLRAYGNAIVPQLASRVLAALYAAPPAQDQGEGNA